MGTIAKGEITLSPVNDAYTVLITPASCTIKADFDGSNPQLDNAKGTITIKRGTRDVPFHVVAPHISTGGSVAFANQTSSIVAFEVTSLPNNVLNGTVGFDIKTDDGFDYQTTVQFAFTIVRESTMLDWIKDWEGSKTKVGGTYIMTPKMFVGKKEDIVDSSVTPPIWKEGALTGIYIGPDILSSQETSAGIYGYLKDNEIFHINADGGFIGGWTFNEAGLQSSNGVVNILAEGSIFAKNPNSTTEYWGIYADGHATFANGNVKFMANGSAEYAGKITSTSGKIGGWSLSKNQLHGGRIILDSANGYIGVYDSDFVLQDLATGDWGFPTNPIGGVKLWYSSASDFGFAAWAAGQKVFQLGSSNMIAGWNFNHQAIWTGSESPYLAQGSFATNSGELTLAPNGLRSTKWYMDADGTAQFVGGKVQFNENDAEMFGWKMRAGRFSAAHAVLSSDSMNNGIFISPADLTDIDTSHLRSTIRNNGGIFIWSDGASSILCAYDTAGKVGFALRTNGYHSIGNWNFDHQSIYTGSTNLSPEGFTMTPGSLILSTDGLIGYLWKLNGDGSGAIAGGNISWDAEGNVTFANSVSLNWSNISGAIGNKLTKIDANGIYTGTISADKITVGNITTDWIKNSDKWGLLVDGSGYLASKNIEWDKNGNINVKGSFSQDIHYAYKCDATVVSKTANHDLEDIVELKLNNHLYIATNVVALSDYDLWTSPGSNWPYSFYPGQYWVIRLPLDPKFIGKEIKIYDCNYGPFSRQPLGWCTTTIKVENDIAFSTKVSYQASFSKENLWKSITIRGGYASFVCIPSTFSNKGCSWICVDFYGALCNGVDGNGTEHELSSLLAGV